jgi:Ser/Thr protein kinase RdoA (MazF antagonist)
MDAALYDELEQLYPMDARPLYFAGGHAWSDGTVYQYTSKGVEYLVKVMPSSTAYVLPAVLERQQWMEYLSRNGVGTLTPLRSSHDQLAESLADGSYLCYSWKKSHGQHIAHSDPRHRQDFYPKWGALVGKMHCLAQDYSTWKQSDCADGNGKPLISREWEIAHFRDWIRDDEVRDAWLELNARLDKLPRTRQNFGMVHNDPHPGNILIEDGSLVLIDFDVVNYQWFILELCICLFSEYAHVEHHSPHKDLLPCMDELFIRPFMRGYASENSLPEEEFAHVEDFIRYRRFLMFAAFYDQIKDAAPQYLQQMKQELISGKQFFPDGLCFPDCWR